MPQASGENGDDLLFNETLLKITTSKKKHQLVLAAAGSGKTHLLISALATRIRSKQIDPQEDKIVVFTFTNNAADELLVRLSSALSSEEDKAVLTKIFIGTIHGWCNQFLSDHGTLSNTKVIDELERDQFVQRAYPILGIDTQYQGINKFDKIEKFLQDLELFYNEALDISDPIIPNNVRKTIEAYLSFLKSQRLMDFGFIIREATTILNKHEDERSFYIYVDEYQDVNPAQVKLLKAMLGADKSRLFSVGDPRQAIYQWRGGDLQRILSFKKDFRDAEVFDLNVNRRSRTGIIAFANTIASKMNFDATISITEMQVSNRRKDDKLSVIEDITTFPQEESIVDLIKKIIRRGIEPSQIAVLLRSVVHHGQPLMDALEQNNIPFDSPNRNMGTQFIDEFIGSIFDVMELADKPPIPGNYEEEQELNQRIDECLSNITKYCKKKKGEIHRAIIAWYNKLNKHTKYSSKIFQNESYNLRKQFFEFCEDIDFKIAPEQTDLQQGFSAITQIMKSIEEAYRRRLIDGYNIRPSPYEVFSRNLKWQLEQQIERWAEVGMPITSKRGITVSTVHAAKGLEWPVVILPYVWKKRFPLNPAPHGTSFPDMVAGRYGTSLEDEKRLWYVAVTRARDRLYIFGGGDSKHPASEFTYHDTFERDDERILTSSVNRIREEKLSIVQSFFKPSYNKIGVSDLLLLLECQYHFYLRKVSGVEVPVGEELGAGNIIHKVVQRLSRGEDSSKLDEILNEEVYLPLAEYSHEQRTKKSIKEKMEFLNQSGILQTIDKSEYKFGVRLGNVMVSGIIDATRKIDNNLIELIDWKYSIQEELLPRYESQLRFYAYALENLGMKVNGAILYDLNESAKADNLEGVNVAISPTAINGVITKANKSLVDLSNNHPITEPHPRCCSICDVAMICPDRILAKVKGI